jgi:hypothetical protein
MFRGKERHHLETGGSGKEVDVMDPQLIHRRVVGDKPDSFSPKEVKGVAEKDLDAGSNQRANLV